MLEDRQYILKKTKEVDNKEIDYKRGGQCLFPTAKRYWKKNIAGRLIPRKLHYTRYMSNINMNSFAKNKRKKNGTITKQKPTNIEKNGIVMRIHFKFSFHQNDIKESP